MPDSVSLLELIWTLAGLTGMIFGIRRRRRLLDKRARLRDDGINGGDMLVANMWIGLHRFFMAMYTAILVSGVVAGFLPPSGSGRGGDSPPPIITISGVVILVMILGMVAAAISSQFYLDAKDREIDSYTRMWREAEKRGNARQGPQDAPGTTEPPVVVC